MRNPVIRVALGVGALILGGLVAGTTAAADAAATQHTNQSWHSVRVCGATGSPTIARCDAVKLVRDGTRPGGNGHGGGGGGGGTGGVSGSPSGMTPTDLRGAYNLTGTSGGTVAIVDAYGYPSLERDLGVYRAQFGLPSCTTSNGCLEIINQSGGTSLPRFNSGWAGEQALDVDAVSAICPGCHILVVQASTASIANLGTAAATAAKQSGVVAISNSYGGGDLSDATYGSYYNHPGIAVTASTGDNGYQGASFPASSSYVTAVGGTTLKKASNTRGWSETVWSGSGSGCSTVNAAIAPSSMTGCSKRAIADVAAAADPNNGGMAVVFPSTSTSSSWTQVGGTSESSPIIASVYALSGNTSGTANSIPYSHPGSLNDVTSGSNGTCPTSQWCHSGSGWDGPTGLGTPNGVGAF